MKTTKLIAVALGAAVLLAGCSGARSDGSGAPPTPTSTTYERTQTVGAIVLPEGAATDLPREPGAGTMDGALIAAAVVLNSGGVVVSGTVESVRTERGEFDLEYPVTTLRVDKTFAGTPGDTVTIRTADPVFAMEEGSRYLVLLAKDTPDAPYYTPVDTYLFDHTDAGWTVRMPTGDEAAKDTEPLVLGDGDVPRLVAEGQDYLDGRLAAGEAKLTITRGDDGGEVVVSGYAPGETIELRVCAVDADFNPKTDASTRCGTGLDQVITPKGPSFAVGYEVPDKLDLGDGSTIECSGNRCGLVAYDAGWPGRVFAIYRA